MSALLLDIGNSRLKWSFYRDGDLSPSAHADYRDSGPEDLCEQLWAAMVPPERVIAASVADTEWTRGLEDWMRSRWNRTVEWQRAAREQGGVRNAYEDPERLGVDRWLAMVGARTSGEPVCIVDCGTAVTVDAVDAEGNHRGGLIAPGLGLLRESISRRATGIPELWTTDGRPLGTDTATALGNGTLLMLAGFVDRAVDEVLAEIGDGARCLITGGDADALRPWLRREYRPDPDLVLRGLARMVESSLS